MAIIDIRNLTFTHDGAYAPIFEDVNFRIDTDWKLGFIGRNGRGKTTFLDLLRGKYEYSGKITSSVKFDYFPYSVDKSKTTEEIFKVVCPAAEDWEIMRELNILDVDLTCLYRTFSTLSNGEQTKALLAALFLKSDGFLLIDEPTNHLDGTGRDIVAKYLNGKRGFILVSHDRAFLDGCVDHILSINKTNIEITSGNFSTWYDNFNKTQAYETAQNAKLTKQIDALGEAAKRTSAWAQKSEKNKSESDKHGKGKSGLRTDKGFQGRIAATLQRRAKAVEGRRERAIEQKSALLKNVEKTEELKLSPLLHRAQKLVTIKDATLYYGQKQACAHVDLEIERGEAIALSGKNGSGKSSLLKAILGDGNIRVDGNITLSSGLIISYVPQSYEFERGTLKDFAQQNGIDLSLFLTVLRKTGFERSDFDGDISKYSDGQKKKVMIAKSLCQSAHLYIWDEPLNFIDIFSRMQIENLLQTYRPTMLFVEHDAAFKAKIATRTVEL